MIYYDRDLHSQNKGLVEIKDGEFLDKIRKDFNSKYAQYNTMHPLICGTIVNKGYY